MSNFLEFLIEFLKTLFEPLWNILVSIFNSIISIFNVMNYVEVFEKYSGDFDGLAWVLAILVVILLVAALGGVTSCAQEETLYGTYVDNSGKSSYTTNVLVVVKGDTIVEVTIAEGSTHYTQGSNKWTGEAWTSKESEFFTLDIE